MDIADAVLLRYEDAAISKYSVMNKKRMDLSDKKLYDACKDFEQIFVKQMLDSMKKTVDRSSSVLKTSVQMNYFEDMLYDSYAKKITESADLGIAKMIYMQLYKNQL